MLVAFVASDSAKTLRMVASAICWATLGIQEGVPHVLGAIFSVVSVSVSRVDA
jgi:hypothetical protein